MSSIFSDSCMQGFGLGPVDFFDSENPKVVHTLRSIRQQISDEVFTHIPCMSCADVKNALGSCGPSLQDLVRKLMALGSLNCDFMENWRENPIPRVLFPRASTEILRDAHSEDIDRIRRIIVHGGRSDPSRINKHVTAGLCNKKFPREFRQEMFEHFRLEYEIAKTNQFDHMALAAYISTHKRGKANVCHNITAEEAEEVLQWALELYKAGDTSILSGDVFSAYLSHPGLSLNQMEFIFERAKKHPEFLTYSVFNSWNSVILERHKSGHSRQYPLTLYRPPAGAADKDQHSIVLSRELYAKYLRLKYEGLRRPK